MKQNKNKSKNRQEPYLYEDILIYFKTHRIHSIGKLIKNLHKSFALISSSSFNKILIKFTAVSIYLFYFIIIIFF